MGLDWLNRYNLIIFEEIDSTNSEALRLANARVNGDYVIISQTQAGGRGTKGRCWSSPVGNLYSSILLQTTFNIKKTLQLPFLVANVIFESINHFAKKQGVKLDIKLKWPNDVLVNNKKIAGILVESIILKGTTYIVIGMGVNIDLAPVINKSVTCMKELGIEIEDPNIFLNILINKFEELYSQWKFDDSFIKIRRDWMKHAYNIGKNIIIDDGVQKTSGIFKELGPDGAMRLQLATGQYCNIVSGEILS